MAKSKVKVKIVEFVNNLLTTKPKLYKPALQTPTVVSAEKFIENIAKETGLSKFQANNVLSCVFQTAGDYMELGNAVQLHEDFGTLKPYIKVKAVSDKDKCNADCIQGMGLRLIPTGKMRSILGDVQFTFTGMSNGTDVEDSELVDTNGSGDKPENQSPEAEVPQTYRMTFTFADGTEDFNDYAEGATITYPSNTSGYQWPTSKPSVMPAQNVTVTEVAISGGGGDGVGDI